MKIRKAKIDEARKIIELHEETIRRVNSKDYPQEQIEAWIGKRQIEKTENMIKDGVYFLALENDSIVGIGAIIVDNIIGLYVSADRQNQGIGTAILNAMEQDAKKNGIYELSGDSTITAMPFYQQHGYIIAEMKTVQIAQGQTLNVYPIKKII